MPATLTIRDEGLSGQVLSEITLDFFTEHITVRDLICRRVREEVRRYNLMRPRFFQSLVQPTEAEVTLNGYKLPKGRTVDPEAQCRHAVKAFEQNGFFILVDDRQVDDLDAAIELKVETKVPSRQKNKQIISMTYRSCRLPGRIFLCLNHEISDRRPGKYWTGI